MSYYHNHVWVIVPAFNESRRIAATLESLCGSFRNVVVVDDGSTDATSAVVARYPVWQLTHSINCGQGAALRTGIRFALQQEKAKILVTFDADGQHNVLDLRRLVEVIGPYDVALGSRFLGHTPGIKWSHYQLLKLPVTFTRLTTGLAITDTHNGLRAFSRHAASCLNITQNRMAHASEILSQIRMRNLSFVEVPVTIDYRSKREPDGRSWWEPGRILWDLLMGQVIP